MRSSRAGFPCGEASKENMRILYGLSGDGLGHAMRSLVVAYELAARGHSVTLACSSGRAHRYLSERWQHRLVRIPGVHTVVEGGAVKPFDSIVTNALQIVLSPLGQVLPALWIQPPPHVVISDFDPWSARYAHALGIPLIALDNIHFLTRCRHPQQLLVRHRDAAAMMYLATENMVPGAQKYMVTTFALAPVCKPDTTLHLPILRPEVSTVRREWWDHVVAYFNDKADHARVARELGKVQGVDFHLYGAPGAQAGVRAAHTDNVWHMGVSDGLLGDMSRARAVIGGAGFTLMTESIALGKPMLAIPFAGQFEQLCNGEYLESLGYGQWAPELNADVLSGFLRRAPLYAMELAGFVHDNNEELYDALEMNIQNARRDAA